MRTIAAPGKVFRSVSSCESRKYDGKTVEFIFDLDGKLFLLSGRFVAHHGTGFETLELHYAGRLAPQDPPGATYVFRVSQAHLRSTAPAAKPGAKVDFLMDKPLGRARARGAFEEWGGFVAVSA